MTTITKLESKVKELSKLLEALKELNAAIDLQDIFQGILDQMVMIAEAKEATLWVLEKEKNQIVAKASSGTSTESLPTSTLSIGEGIVGKVVKTGEAELITDTENVINSSVAYLSPRSTSILTVPLLAKGQIIGAIQLNDKKDGGHFDTRDRELAVILAEQSALSLHNSQMYDELYKMFVSMIRMLAEALDARDPLTKGHSERVARYAWLIGKRMKLDAQDCFELYQAAILHDIGKIGIEDRILRKTTGLTENEYELMKTHTEIGARILSAIQPNRFFQKSIDTAMLHHERMDGSGYPKQLKGEEIPLFARIVGVADAFDAMTTVRTYSEGMSVREAAAELIRCKGSLFDADIVDIFIEILENCSYDLQSFPKTDAV
ncbi:phosphohydrolase [Terribacillus saccharophilus]|uniref:Phosphohydrolase n=1 Tax=Terribacillus saccharophilus TaxID=361277 RepID=A0A075LKV7_9BACI|nr:HD domain-containing phosphohydrolase [Terribacillus goriensis]AIF66567.1 phosphohydrolase [Terribacillus goriensis]